MCLKFFEYALAADTGQEDDACGPEAGESMTVYQYAGNNPVMMNDPMGDLAMFPGARIPVQDYSRGADAGFYELWHEGDPGWAFAERMFIEGGYGAYGGFGGHDVYIDKNGQVLSRTPNTTGENRYYGATRKDVNGRIGAIGDGTTYTEAQALALISTYNKNHPADQGGNNWLSDAYNWTTKHLYQEGSYEISRGDQFSVGIKKGLDVTLNIGSTVMSSGKINNRNFKADIDNTKKFSHEASVSWVVGGGVEYTHDNRNPGEIELSLGALGFLGASVTLDTNGNVTNWFGGISIEAHIAAYLGVQVTYKLGFGK